MRSVTLTGEVNKTPFITVTPVKGWDVLGSKWTISSWSSSVGNRINGQV